MSDITYTSEEFTISVTGETTGETLRGTFRAKKRLSHADRLRRDQYRRELLGQISPDSASPEAMSLALGIADLRVRLVLAPSWWKESNDGLDLTDESVLIAVYEAAQAIEAKTRKAVADMAKGATAELKEEEKK